MYSMRPMYPKLHSNYDLPGWYHVDQGIHKRGFQCVQGLVTLTDVTAGTGGLCLIPGSFQSHEALMDLTGEENNFVEIPASFPALNEKQILPLCQAGVYDMILYDMMLILSVNVLLANYYVRVVSTSLISQPLYQFLKLM